MPSAVKTTTHELAEGRVRVDVEVPADAVEREVESAADALGRNLKVPGFRRGRVPPQVVIQRAGRDAVLDEALRRALPAWYEEAVGRAGVAAVGEPKLDIGSLPAKGGPLAFSIEVSVRPKARLGEYRGLEVGRREPVAEPEEVNAELEGMRESLASLETVDRTAQRGDFAVLDFEGRIDGEPFEGGEARGFLLELGSGRLVEGFEEQLIGAAAGDEREVSVTFPPDYRADEVAGKEADFAVSVKEVKEKHLPDLDDELAAEAGGFDSLGELRDALAAKVLEAKGNAAAAEFREAALDAAVDAAHVDVPPELVEARAREMWRSTARSLARRGIDPNRYLELAGKSEDELVEEAKPDADRSLRRESVLAAVVEAEGIEARDDELLDTLRSASTANGGEPPNEQELRRMLDRAIDDGRDAGLREDVAMRKALDVIVESASPIELDRAKARESLWTPGKAQPGDAPDESRPSGRLWTPGS